MKLLCNPRRVTKLSLALGLALASWLFAAQSSWAAELLVSGDFEDPVGVGEVPNWTLVESISGSTDPVDSAEVSGGGDPQLFIKAFAGGGPLNQGQGNFDNDSLPAGDVDGNDFLIWQRNAGLTGTALPEDGDATGDMNVDGLDLQIWQSNYGQSNAGKLINASLSQTVPGLAGDTYTFQGSSTFEEAYSGLVTTLGDASPHGQIASPTLTQFKMEFLDSGGAVIGTPTTLDLRGEWAGNDPGFQLFHTPLVAVAPAGTTGVRVVAEALDVAWNGDSSQDPEPGVGFLQSAFFNDFSLTRSGAGGTQLLENGDLNLGTPSALDFWNQSENPASRDEILRTAGFANHTASGSLGVWYSAFFGAHSNFEPDPVDGSISQTIQADAGGVYSFSGWSKFEGGYSGGVDLIDPASSGFFAGLESPTETQIELAFLDINGDVISASVIDVEADRKLQNGSAVANDNIWREHTFTGVVAPAGTEFVRLSALMIDAVFNVDVGGALGNQSIFFDDFTLDGPGSTLLANVSVPEPTSVALLTFGMAALVLRRERRVS